MTEFQTAFGISAEQATLLWSWGFFSVILPWALGFVVRIAVKTLSLL